MIQHHIKYLFRPLDEIFLWEYDRAYRWQLAKQGFEFREFWPVDRLVREWILAGRP